MDFPVSTKISQLFSKIKLIFAEYIYPVPSPYVTTIYFYRPEVILNNFTTRLGHSIARMLASLFHYEPEFRGKRAVTFHNQRDYIFFRHHRYEFKNAEKVKLRELGPRFTLRLRALQKGTFDSKTGEYEWIKSGRRHELEESRRKFYL